MAHVTQRPAAVQTAHESIIAAQVKTKVWLELGGEFFAGDGGVHLLGGILRHGSLARTVREIGWSYRPRGVTSGGPSAPCRRRSCATGPGAGPRAAWN
jgi:hypothetical protein